MHWSLPVMLALQGLATPAAASTKNPGLGLRRFSSLVVFGDSWTDSGLRNYAPDANGNIGKPSNNASTGGRVWPQYVEQYVGAKSYDYAVSGAVCDNSYQPSNRNGIVQNQMPTFLANKAYVNSTTGKKILNIPQKETVYAIWIGTNDIGASVFLTEEQPKGLPLTAYTDCVYAQLDQLYESGARKFVLMNVGPLDLIPQYALPENDGVNVSRFWLTKQNYNANITQSSEKIRQYINLLNEVFDYKTAFEVLVAKRYRGSTFAVFDTNSFMADIWHNPAKYLNGTVTPDVTGSIVQCGPSCNVPGVRDSFMWYDELHPSEQTDRVVAKEFIDVVSGNSKWATYLQS